MPLRSSACSSAAGESSRYTMRPEGSSRVLATLASASARTIASLKTACRSGVAVASRTLSLSRSSVRMAHSWVALDAPPVLPLCRLARCRAFVAAAGRHPARVATFTRARYRPTRRIELELAAQNWSRRPPQPVAQFARQGMGRRPRAGERWTRAGHRSASAAAGVSGPCESLHAFCAPPLYLSTIVRPVAFRELGVDS